MCIAFSLHNYIPTSCLLITKNFKISTSCLLITKSFKISCTVAKGPCTPNFVILGKIPQNRLFVYFVREFHYQQWEKNEVFTTRTAHGIHCCIKVDTTQQKWVDLIRLTQEFLL